MYSYKNNKCLPQCCSAWLALTTSISLGKQTFYVMQMYIHSFPIDFICHVAESWLWKPLSLEDSRISDSSFPKLPQASLPIPETVMTQDLGVPLPSTHFSCWQVLATNTFGRGTGNVIQCENTWTVLQVKCRMGNSAGFPQAVQELFRGMLKQNLMSINWYYYLNECFHFTSNTEG